MPAEGQYTFYVDSDDGSRLRVDDQLVVEYDGIHGLGQEKRVTLALPKGRMPIQLEYFQRENGWGLNVAWSGDALGVGRRPLSKPDAETAKKTVNVADLIKVESSPLISREDDRAARRARQAIGETQADQAGIGSGLVRDREWFANARDVHPAPRQPTVPGEKVEPAYPAMLGGGVANVPKPPYESKSSGRRLTLADWIASPDNPLTGRVMVNRIWQHHFGRGIVRSPNNFGGLGDPPTHPELLDWLAARVRRRRLAASSRCTG